MAAFLVFSVLLLHQKIPGISYDVEESADVEDEHEIYTHAWSLFEKQQPILPVYAHRGYSSRYVENTPEAFAQALIKGCPQIELDVWLSKDGNLIVSHDESLKRIYKSPLLVTQCNPTELEKLKASNGQPVLSLQRILDLFGDHATYLIELKSGADCVQPFIELMKQYPHLLSSIQVQDWSVDSLEQLEAEFPYMYKQLLVGELKNLAPGLQSSAINGIAINYKCLDEDVLQMIHQANKKCFAYTVNDAKDMDRLLNMGVDGLISDYPDLVMEKTHALQN